MMFTSLIRVQKECEFQGLRIIIIKKTVWVIKKEVSLLIMKKLLNLFKKDDLIEMKISRWLLQRSGSMNVLRWIVIRYFWDEDENACTWYRVRDWTDSGWILEVTGKDLRGHI